MKVIFLDIDGVLNVIGQGYDEFGQLFHKHFEDNLEYIINSTGAKIVISSSWRIQGLDRMRQMWKLRGLAGEIIDVTCDVVQACEFSQEQFYDKVERGHEIQEWLNRHPEVVNYVIIDDDSDMLQSQLNNFVKTSDNIDHPDCIDIGYGLTKLCSEKAISILNNTNPRS